jgi:peptidylprolyl isomerase
VDFKDYKIIKTMKIFIPILLFVIILGGWFILKEPASTQAPADVEKLKSASSVMSDETKETVRATLHTNKGDIVLELFTGDMPITTGNFLKLAKEGFYNEVKFHRVIPGFMIQGGDPNSKGDDPSTYGIGGPGYTVQDEFVEGDGLSNVRGTISMANTGAPNSGGSQFFINVANNTNLDFDKQPLASKHPVFGRVSEGMGIVDAISNVSKNERDVPLEPVIIQNISIEE